MKLRNNLLLYSLAILFIFQGVVQSEEKNSLQEQRLNKIYRDIRIVVKRHYPESSCHFLGNKIHFEFNTRPFIIHVPLKTGEWQDPWEERGPKKGGILGDIELRDGQYIGAAVVPQTFDRKYYSILLLAPYSQKFDCHLYVHIYHPHLDNESGFIKEIVDIINSFEKRLEIKY